MKNKDVFYYLREAQAKKLREEIEEVEGFANKDDQDYRTLQPGGGVPGPENDTDAPSDTPDVLDTPEELPSGDEVETTGEDVLREFDNIGTAFESLTSLGATFSGVLSVLMGYRKGLVTDSTINNMDTLKLVIDITERMVYMNSAVLALEKELGEFYSQREEILKAFQITPETGTENPEEETNAEGEPTTNPDEMKPAGTAVEGEVRTESRKRPGGRRMVDSVYASTGNPPVGPFYSEIVFMQDSEADEPLRILEDDGPEAAAAYLAQWDNGENPKVSKEAPWGDDDHTYDVKVPNAGRYILSVNNRIGYIGLTKKLSREEYLDITHESIKRFSSEKWHFVEDDSQVVRFVGTEAQAASFYKKEGGSKAGLHLMSMSKKQGEDVIPKPTVGRAVESRKRTDEKKQISGVKTKWEPEEGFFNQSATKIARGLRAASKDLKQATSRLNFYINRAGSNLSPEEKKRLEAAGKKLRGLFEGLHLQDDYLEDYDVEVEDGFSREFVIEEIVNFFDTFGPDYNIAWGENWEIEGLQEFYPVTEASEVSIPFSIETGADTYQGMINFSIHSSLSSKLIISSREIDIPDFPANIDESIGRISKPAFPDEDDDGYKWYIYNSLTDLFWSEEEGWVSPESATSFTDHERRSRGPTREEGTAWVSVFSPEVIEWTDPKKVTRESVGEGADIVDSKGYQIGRVETEDDLQDFLFRYAEENKPETGTFVFVDSDKDDKPRAKMTWNGNAWSSNVHEAKNVRPRRISKGTTPLIEGNPDNYWKYFMDQDFLKIVEDLGNKRISRSEAVSKIINSLIEFQRAYPEMQDLGSIIGTFKSCITAYMEDSPQFEKKFDYALETLFDWADDELVWVGDPN